MLESYRGVEPAVELTATPFHPQDAYQCGPAALATVLGAAGRATDPQALVGEVYLPGRGGSLQIELQAATRRRGLVAWPLQDGMAELLAELGAGRPVLVLQKLGIGPWPGWHYAVVVGYDRRQDLLWLRSGTERRLALDARRFDRTWARAGRWAFVALPAGELPTRDDLPAYLQAAAALELAGQAGAAALAYEAGLERWPDAAMLLFGLANARYALGELDRAEPLYRRLLEGDPDHLPARNNLAQTLIDRGCPQAALELLGDIDDPGPYAPALEETRAAAVQAVDRLCPVGRCPVSLAPRCEPLLP